MNWLKYVLVVPAIVDLARLIRDRRRGKECPDDDERLRRNAEEIEKAGREIARDVRKKR